MVWTNIPLSESLIQPIILALLPVSTLFVVDESSAEPNQRFVASGSRAGDHHGGREALPEVTPRSVHHPRGTVHVLAELDGKLTESSELNSKAGNGRRLQEGQFERELQEIDRM